MNGQVSLALSENSAELLVPEPVGIRRVEVLASKVEKVADSEASDKKAGLSVGLRVLIKANPENVLTFRNFLTVSCYNLVEPKRIMIKYNCSPPSMM